MFEIYFAASILMVSCFLNVVFLEHLIKASPDCGSTLLFFQFAFIAVEGFIFHMKWGTRKRHIPLKDYTTMVALFFASSTTNNLALGYQIPMPLHMIFKSGSLVANMCLGVFLLKRSYQLSKYISVALVSFGIFLCTLITSLNAANAKATGGETMALSSVLVGTALLLVSLFLSARMGIYQETLAMKYGRHSREALFYNHTLPLPLFIFLLPSITKNIAFFSSSQMQDVPVVSTLVDDFFSNVLSFSVDFKIPVLWQYLIASVITQYCCIRSVFYLTSECTSLTVTLLITLRKFVSLVFSVFFFKNSFTFYHWIGTAFVFCGALIYADVINIHYIIIKFGWSNGTEERNKVEQKCKKIQ